MYLMQHFHVRIDKIVKIDLGKIGFVATSWPEEGSYVREFVDNLAPSIPYCGTLAWDGYYKRCELKPRSRVLFDNCNAGRKILLVMPDDHKWLYELKKWTK